MVWVSDAAGAERLREKRSGGASSGMPGRRWRQRRGRDYAVTPGRRPCSITRADQPGPKRYRRRLPSDFVALAVGWPNSLAGRPPPDRRPNQQQADHHKQ